MTEQIANNPVTTDLSPEEVERRFDEITSTEVPVNGEFPQTIEDELDALHPALPEPHEDSGVDVQDSQLLNEVTLPVEETSERPLAHV